MEVNTAVIEREVERYQPFLLTTTFLMEAVRNGVGRETAHEIIKEHALAAARALRSGAAAENDLPERLAGDSRLKLTKDRIAELLQSGAENTGAAGAQVDRVLEVARQRVDSCPGAADYLPGEIL
jgi:adenylosuccinate lyase